jgi:hypothetical protein
MPSRDAVISRKQITLCKEDISACSNFDLQKALVLIDAYEEMGLEACRLISTNGLRPIDGFRYRIRHTRRALEMALSGNPEPDGEECIFAMKEYAALKREVFLLIQCTEFKKPTGMELLLPYEDSQPSISSMSGCNIPHEVGPARASKV